MHAAMKYVMQYLTKLNNELKPLQVPIMLFYEIHPLYLFYVVMMATLKKQSMRLTPTILLMIDQATLY
jgi:hypothetical protein